MRLVRFPDVAATVAVRDLVGAARDEAELLVDEDGRVVVIAWPNAAAAPEVVRLAFAYDDRRDHVAIKLRDASRTAAHAAIGSAALSRPPDVQLDADGRLIGLEFSAASIQLPSSFLKALRRGPLRGVLGVELTCSVTGRFSQITDFAEYARARLRLWRDGDVAG